MTGNVLRAVGAAFCLAVLVAACGSDRNGGGDDDDSCNEDDDCASGRCEEGECVPSDGSSSGAGGMTSSGVGASGGMSGSTASGMGASTSSASTGSSTESASTGSSMGHLPQCVAYADHVCALCYANGCPAEWYESVASDCDSSWRICSALYMCATTAPSCEAAVDCSC